jgi:hypothetical protein
MQVKKVYAGIGARLTPEDICDIMTVLARNLAEAGWMLRSGHASGADRAFELGTLNRRIYLPWDGYNGGRQGREGFWVPPVTDPIMKIAEQHHAAWDDLTPGIKKLMYRNASVIMGPQAVAPVEMVICWTPRAKVIGGTGHALRIAAFY